jgi:hypothetical protein
MENKWEQGQAFKVISILVHNVTYQASQISSDGIAIRLRAGRPRDLVRFSARDISLFHNIE